MNASWDEYRRLVLAKLDDHENEITRLRQQLAEARTEVALLKLKAGVWGAMGAAIPTIAAILWVLFARTAEGGTMDSTLVDSVATAAADSTAMAGFLMDLAQRWIPTVPHEITLVIVGALTALGLDLFERGALKLRDWTQRVPLLGGVLGVVAKIWAAEWQTRGGQVLTARAVVNPLLALAVGTWGAGNPVVGVIAAGVRSMATKPVNEALMKRLRLMIVPLAIAGGLFLVPPAHAQDAPADSSSSTRLLPDWIGVDAGLGYWVDWVGSLPSSPKPTPWVGGGATAVVGWNVTVRADVKRGFVSEGAAPWFANVGVRLHY